MPGQLRVTNKPQVSLKASLSQSLGQTRHPTRNASRSGICIRTFKGKNMELHASLPSRTVSPSPYSQLYSQGISTASRKIHARCCRSIIFPDASIARRLYQFHSTNQIQLATRTDIMCFYTSKK